MKKSLAKRIRVERKPKSENRSKSTRLELFAGKNKIRTSYNHISYSGPPVSAVFNQEASLELLNCEHFIIGKIRSYDVCN